MPLASAQPGLHLRRRRLPRHRHRLQQRPLQPGRRGALSPLARERARVARGGLHERQRRRPLRHQLVPRLSRLPCGKHRAQRPRGPQRDVWRAQHGGSVAPRPGRGRHRQLLHGPRHPGRARTDPVAGRRPRGRRAGGRGIAPLLAARARLRSLRSGQDAAAQGKGLHDRGGHRRGLQRPAPHAGGRDVAAHGVRGRRGARRHSGRGAVAGRDQPPRPARPALVVREGPAQARRHRRPGAGRPGRRHGRARPGPSADEQGSTGGRASIAGRARASRRRQDPRAPGRGADAAGGPRPAHCLRQRGEHAPRPRVGPPARDQHPHGDRRPAVARGPPAPRRERRPRSPGRSGGSRSGLRPHPDAHHPRPAPADPPSLRPAGRRARPGLHGTRRPRGGGRGRPGSGAPRLEAGPALRPAGREPGARPSRAGGGASGTASWWDRSP